MYSKVLILFVFASFLLPAQNSFDRYGFDLELSAQQLSKIIDKIDVDELYSREIYPNNYNVVALAESFLDRPQNFYSLPITLREELIHWLPERDFYDRFKVHLYTEAPLDFSKYDPSERSYLSTAWGKVKTWWKQEVSRNLKMNLMSDGYIRLSQLSTIEVAKILIKIGGGFKWKKDALDSMPKEFNELLKHIEYYRDSEALEFRYRYDYEVHDQKRFLHELNLITNFLEVKDLMDKPIRIDRELLSLHLHLSGKKVTRDFIQAWNFKIMIDFLNAGFGEELLGRYGYTNNILMKGFARLVMFESNHGELRNLSVSPREVLKYDTTDLITFVLEALNPNNNEGEILLKKIFRVAPNFFYDVFVHSHYWVKSGKLSYEDITFGVDYLVKQFEINGPALNALETLGPIIKDDVFTIIKKYNPKAMKQISKSLKKYSHDKLYPAQQRVIRYGCMSKFMSLFGGV